MGGGGFKGDNVQKLLNAWGVARGDMLKFRIDQRIKGTTSPKQMRQLLESKVEKFRQTFQVWSAKFKMAWTSGASHGRKCRNSGWKQIFDSPKREKKESGQCFEVNQRDRKWVLFAHANPWQPLTPWVKYYLPGFNGWTRTLVGLFFTVQ